MGTTRLRHGGTVHAVAVAPDGRSLASAADDGTVSVWDPEPGQERVRFTGKVPARSLAYSPDGLWIASTGQSTGVVSFVTPVHLWESATGKEVRQFNGRGMFAVFTPDGKSLAVENWDDVVLYDVATGKEVRRLAGEGHGGRLHSAAFAPDGTVFATKDDAGTVCLWDVGTGRILRQLSEDAGYDGVVAFTPDGKSVLAAGHADIRFWDVATGKETAHWSVGKNGMIECLAFGGRGQGDALLPLARRPGDGGDLRRGRQAPRDRRGQSRADRRRCHWQGPLPRGWHARRHYRPRLLRRRQGPLLPRRRPGGAHVGGGQCPAVAAAGRR
jgi:WD40 repeat protein